MLKLAFSSLVATLVLMSPSLAQTTATVATAATGEQSPTQSASDECMKPAFELAEAAEKKQLPDASLDKLDTMFSEMERHCVAQQLAEAKTVASEIKSLIETER
jgi:hypothetical protein